MKYFKVKKKPQPLTSILGVVQIAASNIADNAFYDVCPAFKNISIVCFSFLSTNMWNKLMKGLQPLSGYDSLAQTLELK